MSTVPLAQDVLRSDGGEIRFWRCADERAEALAVAADIERLIFREAAPPRQIAVLLPDDLDDVRELAGALQERAVPHLPHGAAGMLARAEVRDALAWMRLMADPSDAGAAVRVLIRPPVEMRQVDLAQVVKVARRRRLDIVSALPAAVQSPQVSPQARERIDRFVAFYDDLSSAFAEMRPEQFVGHLLGRIGTAHEGPLTGSSQAAERGASLAWLQGQARSFSRRFPWADSRELVSHLLLAADSGEIEDAEERPLIEQRPDAEQGEGLVQLLRAGSNLAADLQHAYLLGLQSSIDELQSTACDAALSRLAAIGCCDVVLSYPVRSRHGENCKPVPTVERMRTEIGAQWEEIVTRRSDPDETIEAALRAMRQELLDGVGSLGGRLRELRLDTDIDISHGIVRYLELVKLATLLERPDGQGLAEALADVNARLLPAVTSLQREILESSTLDEDLIAGRDLAHAAPVHGRSEADEPSLQRFLPRKGNGLLLSASDIELYRSCPLRYKFARVLRIPVQTTRSQRFGIALHQVLERYHTAGGGSLPELLALLEQAWRRAGFSGDDEDRVLHEKAVVALRRYHERLAEQRSQPVWFERMFAFRLGRHQVRGRVDRVDRLPDGGYELIDYKTGRPKSEEQLRQDVQLSLYAIAARESWQLEASRQAYHYLLDDVKVPLQSSEEDAERVRSLATESAEAILSERFEPTPASAVCGMCDYRVVCPVAEG